ncbi:LacI family DNA-binding transcriptional regulator [uncultured Cellulomonas sp.]|uniref:LacI family DNA-binding transcriptional regulator n=1 Tax=uncultured Cellulomonas sp. TaxID=189682 RepID=UPI002629D250|nr:LacI family DNA-binding transcriptional regulator [uncultured Cellulomonas sp.]
MAVSARDVARVAGVSVSTVSRALSRPDDVAAHTRDRVLATARGMGYRPNAAARTLITGRTGNIGLIVPDIENPFFASVTKGVQLQARSAGYAVFIADSDEDPSIERELARNLAKQVDGLILCSPRAPGEVLDDLARECTLVLVNRRRGDIPSVTVDNREGVRQAIGHLRALGHRRLAYVGGPATSWSNRERLAAFLELGGEHEDTEVVDLGFFQPYVSGGVAAGDLALASGATAVLAYNDVVAFGLLERFRQRGVRVPDDVSVVGTDDIPVSALTSPALTSVGLPLVSSGRAGVDMLLGLVGDPAAVPVHHHHLAVQLVVRGSTGPRDAAARPHPG